MNTKAHIVASTTLAAGIYAATSSAASASAALLSGIFIDLDHILDFYLFSGEPFSIKGFTDWCYEGRWERLMLILHSYELYAVYSVMVYLYPHPILTGILLGVGLHLILDQVGNRRLIKAFTISKWFYFFTFRAWGAFHKDWLRTPKT